MEQNEILEIAQIEVPLGGRVLLASDLLLDKKLAQASSSSIVELSLAIEALVGPSLVIFNGNLFDLLSNPTNSASQSLAAYPKLASALRSFTKCPNHSLLIIPGSRDTKLAWDAAEQKTIASLGATIAFSAELKLQTATGTRTIKVEPGQNLDPRFAYKDPTNSADTPLGHHFITEIFPNIGPASKTWLEGLDRIQDQKSLSRFFVSRLLYRRLIRYSWWLLIPFLAAMVLKLPLLYAISVLAAKHRATLSAVWPQRLLLLELTSIVDLGLLGAAITYISRKTWLALQGSSSKTANSEHNEAPKSKARDLITQGYSGFITSHTLTPELAHLGKGFYANTGSIGEVVQESPSLLGFPSVFIPFRQLSWLEIETGADLHVRLLFSILPLPGPNVIERFISKSKNTSKDTRPKVVASYPDGKSWPPMPSILTKTKKKRRLAASAIAISGLLDLASGITPPLKGRLEIVLDIIPFGVTVAAGALVALFGLVLLLLARSVRRGQRQGWFISLVLLASTTVLNLVNGGNLEEAITALVVFIFLLRNESSFKATTDRRSLKIGIKTVILGLVLTIGLSTMSLEAWLAFSHHHHPLGVFTALEAVTQRMIGIQSVFLPHRVNVFLSPALFAIGIFLAATGLLLIFRPVVTRNTDNKGGSEFKQAKEIVKLHAKGTLDYFALRSDKQWFFYLQSVVAYAVYSGVCLVSPDPIGPESERDAVWKEFHTFTDKQGWTLAVLGAGQDWLSVYRQLGMQDLYLGDEAVVDLENFSLEGGRNKSLRQAVNRIERNGYTISFHDPASIDATLKEKLTPLMSKSRKGEVERGFSMTLGRIFDPIDEGLLLALASDPEGNPVAFCQYVPAPGINGFSLDLMRRDNKEHPNGLMDFVVVSTIEELKKRGFTKLGLNFATMRAVLAGEAGDSLTQRVERWMLKKMSSSMQIESLWKFNAKYDPSWQPRFAVYDSTENALSVALAIARAESFWELPVVGKLLSSSKSKKNKIDNNKEELTTSNEKQNTKS